MTLNSQILKGNVKSLKDCSKLKQLEIGYSELTEEFFDDIKSPIPYIKRIHIKTRHQMSDQFFTSLSSMKYLQKVLLNYKKVYLYNKCLMDLKFKNEIQLLNSNCGKVDNNISYWI